MKIRILFALPSLLGACGSGGHSLSSAQAGAANMGGNGAMAAAGGASPTCSGGRECIGEGGSSGQGGETSTNVAPILPLEVFGPAGTVLNVPFSVLSSRLSVAGVATLTVRVHGLHAENQGSLRLNGGDWVAMNNANAKMGAVARAYGGIGGGFATLDLRFELDPALISTGENTVTFRFEGDQNGIVSGYRVVKFDLVNGEGSSLLPPDSFKEDDPATWTAPLAGPDAIAAGEQLWHSAQLIDRVGDVSVPLRAHCSDCHAQDGRDLHYFNYSNYSIIKRSQFHGLSEEQGQQIASYVRSLTGPAPKQARPWNPPYQPGPGIDARPAEEWAAGAGIDAVLERDADTLKELFPTGIKRGGLTEPDARLPYEEVRIAMELPDWNRWLATRHPMDALGACFDSDPFNKDYLAIRERLQAPDHIGAQLEPYGRLYAKATATEYGGNNLLSAMGFWLADREFGPTQTSYACHLPDTLVGAERVEAQHSLALWQMTKAWELHQEFNLETIGPEMFAAGADPRMWLTSIFFVSSPFQMGLENNDGNGLYVRNELYSRYLSNAWYHLQLVVNNSLSHHRPGLNNPYDEGYFWTQSQGLAHVSGTSDAMRMIVNYVAFLQGRANLLPSDPSGGGWNVGRTDPGWIFAEGSKSYSDLSGADLKALLEVLIGAWLEKSRSYSVDELRHTAAMDPGFIADPNATLQDSGGGYASQRFGDHIIYLVLRARRAGVSEELLASICDWAKQLYPSYDWEQLKSKDRSAAF